MPAEYAHRGSIEKFVRELAPLEPLLIVLFGSVASGDHTPSSDADVVVVFSETADWDDVYRCSDGWVQPLVTSLRQLERRLDEGDSLAHEVVERGELLCGPPELWERLRQSARSAQHRLGMTREPMKWSYAREDHC